MAAMAPKATAAALTFNADSAPEVLEAVAAEAEAVPFLAPEAVATAVTTLPLTVLEAAAAPEVTGTATTEPLAAPEVVATTAK